MMKFCSALAASALALLSTSGTALADESGVSFWIPGFFGSLAATPQQPGWSLATINYHTTVSAGGEVALAREFEIRNVPLTFKGTASASVDANVVMQMFIPSCV